MYRLGILTTIIFIGSILFFNLFFIDSWQTGLVTTLHLDADPKQLGIFSQSISQLIIVSSIVSLLGIVSVLLLLLSGGRSARILKIDQEGKKVIIGKKDTGETERTEDSNIQEQLQSAIQSISDNIQDEKEVLLEKILWKICGIIEASQGAFYVVRKKGGDMVVEMIASYAYYSADTKKTSYKIGEGLVGQVVKDATIIRHDSIPEGYITIVSGLGNAKPTNLIMIPVKDEQSNVLGVLEFASFNTFSMALENALANIGQRLAVEILKMEYAKEEIKTN